MEQHPVPQNVTTFQFRLIGDMTIKQFGYLAGGAILAYISYILPLPFFFTWPLSTLFVLGGIGFAFVPIEERPMDVWVLSFIRSIYSPTQFIWHQQAPLAPPPPATATPSAARTATPQGTTSVLPKTASDVLQGVFSPPSRPPADKARIVSTGQQTNIWNKLRAFFSFTAPAKAPVAPAPSAHFTTPSVVGHHLDTSSPPTVAPQKAKKAIEETKEKEVILEQKLSTLKKDLEDKTMTEARVLELQKQLTEILSQKEKMQQELEFLRKQAAAPSLAADAPSAPQGASHTATPQTPQAPTVKIITPDSAVKAGLPRLTTFPNVVTGIIKDSENNLLPGVLVTVKDKDTMPLRALKTNRLGQFAASTPLANGVYFVEIEDPRGRFIFDRVQITLNGSVVPALEIVAKSQKQINRAMLEKELFGKQP
jgi:hypothetical protein